MSQKLLGNIKSGKRLKGRKKSKKKVPNKKHNNSNNEQSSNENSNSSDWSTGGSGFINIPKYGKRKIRYQKNGIAYVIVNKKKLKLNK